MWRHGSHERGKSGFHDNLGRPIKLSKKSWSKYVLKILNSDFYTRKFQRKLVLTQENMKPVSFFPKIMLFVFLS